MIMGTLLALDRFSKDGADKVQAFFNPALNWIQRWLPLFYVPTLVVLPQAIQGIPGAIFLVVAEDVGCAEGLFDSLSCKPASPTCVGSRSPALSISP